MASSPVLSARTSPPAEMGLQSPSSSSPTAADQKKKGAPTCAGAPQRAGHCRVCARTVVLGATSRDRAPGENLHVVSARGVLGDVETLTLHLNGGAQAYDDIDDLVEDRRTHARPDQRGAD